MTDYEEVVRLREKLAGVERQLAEEKHAHGCTLSARDGLHADYQRVVSLLRDAREPQLQAAPDDWVEFAISAFNEGWAAKESGEFPNLKDAYEWSHVKLQIYGDENDPRPRSSDPSDREGTALNDCEDPNG
jgi:hypothetical protein